MSNPNDPQRGEMMQFPWSPVPTNVSIFGVQMPGQGPAVVVQFKTPDSMMTTFWSVEDLRDVIRQLVRVSDEAASGLIIPSGNGEGVVDLNRFRDQGHAEPGE